MEQGAKKKHFAFALLAGIHGCDVSRVSPEEFFALWLWRHENDIRAANRVRMGEVASNAELPIGWFYATMETRDEARAAYDKHIASIAAARSI